MLKNNQNVFQNISGFASGYIIFGKLRNKFEIC